ncbi:HNH endonuclease signature motif containing protein [Sphingopyxis sp. 113P3]|uniref:HNH endonuclease signature motif containing protein n=1 Tax=Sphingopyxis sp. (strain 113P3) TaxID=292913 RepID=UPI0006BD2F6B|nr:HNH endonuclease signature motif containing protein [Sphingopyxis sp. 113P3]ALC12519.1 hypothetical protein LH20_11205 [Sphingopyxis sp. 113P3]
MATQLANRETCRPAFSRDDIARFQSRVSPEPNSGCWLWLGAANEQGRGSFRYGMAGEQKRTGLASRISYEMAIGPIPDGMQVLHRCDVPLCVNPDHLFLGTVTDNMRDMVAKGRHRLTGLPLENSLKTHCRHGHLLDGDNLWIRADGARICKSCRARIARNYRRKCK